MDRRGRNIKREKERKLERVKVKIQRRLASRKKQCYKHETYSSEKRQKKQYKKVDIDYLAAKTN